MTAAGEAPGALVVPVADLLASPGRRLRIDGPHTLADVRTVAGGISDDRADLALVLECQGAQVMVAGTVAASWELECRRCLEPVRVPVSCHLTEVFEDRPADGETFPLAGEQVDLAPVLRQAVLLTLPMAPLCNEDCRGPVEGVHFGPAEGVHFGPTTDSDEGAAEPAAEPQRDPRWAALDDFEPPAGRGT